MELSCLMTRVKTTVTYSRVCLVRLSNAEDPCKTIEGIAILDEQSTTTLISPEAVAALEIPEENCDKTSYCLTTVGSISS